MPPLILSNDYFIQSLALFSFSFENSFYSTTKNLHINFYIFHTLQPNACVIFRQPDIADGPKPTGGEGFATRDVPGNAGGAAAHEGGGPLWPGGKNETV